MLFSTGLWILMSVSEKNKINDFIYISREHVMKNIINAVLALSLSLSPLAMAQVSCTDFKNETYPEHILSTAKILTKSNWKSFDVIANFRFNECADGVAQEQIEVNGEKFWSFKTNDDACDGGNTYGAIYSSDLKTPIAHIYDGSVMCEQDWLDKYKGKSHSCDDAAELLVEKNLVLLGLKVTDLSSTLELRPNYIYSKIEVMGFLNGDIDKEVTSEVLFRPDSCRFGAATITSLPIFSNEEDGWEKL
jgi:hypothetical protein